MLGWQYWMWVWYKYCMWQCWMWVWYLEGCVSPEGVAVLNVGVVPGGVW
jgi:hypothetical protein